MDPDGAKTRCNEKAQIDVNIGMPLHVCYRKCTNITVHDGHIAQHTNSGLLCSELLSIAHTNVCHAHHQQLKPANQTHAPDC